MTFLNDSQKDEQKEEMCPGEAFRTMEDICCYLDQWQNILTAQSTALGEQTERLDNEAKEELVALRHHLMAKAAEELRCVQHRSFVQELLKLGVPKLDVQQAAEEHQREVALDIKRLEKENWSKMMAAEQFHQSAGEKLREELLSSIAEQRQLREWEQVVFL